MFNMKIKATAAVMAAAVTAGGAGMLELSKNAHAAQSKIPVITVDENTARGEISPYTRCANHRHGYGGFGMYDTENNEVYKDFLQKTKESKTGVVRYPGGTIANLFTWKDTVGPISERKNVVLGNSYASVFPYYGVDEHMRFCEEIGAKAIYMVGEASETPESAADLVEYLNGIPGENKNGGTDWAQVRADNGHSEPYGVTHFEIGNEMHLDNQRYWMSNPSVLGKTDFAKRYAEGDTVQMTNHVMRTYGTWDDNVSTGKANQRFYSRYNPLVENTETIYVNGEKYSKIDDLSSAGKDDKVYQFDYKTGEVMFGDGEHGKIPESGAKITADYQHKHAGFTEYYEAMKAVDPSIKVYTCMQRSLEFLDTNKCDGLVNHNYIGFPDGMTTAKQMHDNYMDIADRLVAQTETEDSFVKEKSGRNDFISAVTEFGTIPIPRVYSKETSDIARDEARSLSRSLAFASTFIGTASAETDIHVHQAYTAYSFGGGPALPNADFVYNSLYAPNPNDLSQTIEGATALAYKLIGNGICDSVRNSWIENNPVINGSKTYEALRVLATREGENGDVYLLVLNRSAQNDITATVNLPGYSIKGEAQISTLNAEDITSCNTPEHPNDVSISSSQLSLGEGKSSFCYDFPAHSLVSIKLSGSSKDAFEQAGNTQDFESTDIGSIPESFTATANGAEVVSDPQNPQNKVLKMPRTGTNAKITATLSGQNIQSADIDKYSDTVKISYRLMAPENVGRVDASVKAVGKEVMHLAFDTCRIKNNNMIRANYEKNRWYNIEIVINNKAQNVSVYVDGEYLYTRKNYMETVTAPMDYMVFDVENTNASFLLDDFSVKVCNTDVQPQITQIEPTRLYVQPGQDLSLPETVFARYNTGETEEKSVTWEPFDSELLKKEGKIVVYGAVSGLDIKAKAFVNVQVRKIAKLVAANVTTVAGISPVLPDSVTAVFNDEISQQVQVAWEDIPAGKYAKKGSFTVDGTVEGTELKAIAQITVNATKVVKILPVNITVNVGSAPKLPSKVTVEYDNGTTKELTVRWKAISADKYATAGSFTVTGTVVGSSIKATAFITVVGSSKPKPPAPNTNSDAPKNGTATVNGKTILYKNGKAVTGTKIVTVSGKTYAVKNSAVVTGKKRIVAIGKKLYVVNKSGIVQKSGKAKFKTLKIGKKTYIVNKKGAVLKNKKSVKVGKKLYKISKNGVAKKLEKKVKA